MYINVLYYCSGSPPYTEDECKKDCRKTNCQDYFNTRNDDPEFKCN